MKRKTHYFTKEQAEHLINNEVFLERKTAFQFGYDTGARAGEIITISAEHLHLDKGDMLLWDSKKKDWKPVPLSKDTVTTIQLYLNTTKLKAKLFPVTTVTLNNWLKEACKREGIIADHGTRIRWHSWRGTFVRTHRTLGDKWLMQVTGDSYLTLLQYYEEHSLDDLRRIKHGL